MSDVLPLIEESVETSASPVQAWALVSDLGRMSQWSPQVVRTRVHSRPVALGTRMTNLNRRGPLFWPTNAKVVRFDPHREIAFKVLENGTTWSYTLVPTATDGTRITARREAPHGVSAVSRLLTRTALGGVAQFQDELREGMRQTLRRIKAELEG